MARLDSKLREIRWSKKRKTKLWEDYEKGSHATLTRKKKSARQLKIEVSKTYKLGDLWQWHTEWITSKVNIPDDLAFPEKSRLISRDNSTIFLSNIPRDCEPPLSKEEIKRNLRVDGLKDLSQLLKLIFE